MPHQVTTRSATPEERAALEKVLTSVPSSAARVKQAMVNGLMLWGFTALGLIGMWLLLGWFGSRWLGMDIGAGSTATKGVIALIVLGCAAHAVQASLKWFRSVPDMRALLREDIAKGEVNEEHYHFDAARRFQEPEHGGLMYFLRSAEDEVFPVHDHESQNLGVAGKDPLQSSYRPRADLLVVRALKSGFILRSQASGTQLDVGDPTELGAPPEAWPEAGELCGIPWSQLDARLGPGAAAAKPEKT